MNRLHFQHGPTTFGNEFGGVHSVTPICLAGLGHTPHVQVRFSHGLRLDLAPETLAALVREAPAALAALPITPDCDDAVGVGDE